MQEKPGFNLPLSFLAAALLLTGCGDGDGEALFEQLPPEATGVTFENTLVEDTTLNILNYLYFYDGGGVAAGDVNNDGLVDLYFTANQGPNKLYLNQGDFVFEDVTERAGVAGDADWTKGVTMADVNGDGFLDLYVSTVTYLGQCGRNALYINNGNLTFTDRAAEYGLDHEGFSNQAAFFDYDRDGDLDMYLVNHSVHTEDTYGKDTLRYERHPTAGDKLYRNDGERFVDVSEAAGIYGGRIGYGLGIAVSDFDFDGCPDLFISNDFHEHDYLYYNTCEGAFTEAIQEAMGHTSRASMGNDAADIDNDGRPDVVILDMLPERQDVLNTSAGADPYELYMLKRRFGYYHQVTRNSLQLNRGHRRFSEIGYLAGIHATDWSWASLLADLDNDGFKDLFVTNGIYHRPNDLDYVRYVSTPAIQATLQGAIDTEDLALLDRMPQVPLANYAYRNNGDPGSGPGQALTFTNKAAAWRLDQPGFSNGAAYADLDNDGDLDLVVNNLNAPATLYENHADTRTDHHYLTIILQGEGKNTAGFGARVIVKHAGAQQMVEQAPTRGWISSVDPRLHIGLGAAATVDSLIVIWPDGRHQTLTDVAADQILTVRQAEAAGNYRYPSAPPDPLFEDATDALALDYRHQENAFLDFNREILMPHRLSTEGPALAVGDVNGDGLDDLFAGGAKWQRARLLVQQSDGLFTPTNEALWHADSLHEDVDAAFFDAEGDGDLDLYVVSSGNEFWGQNDALKDRLYLNDGGGAFTRAENALPDLYANGSVVAPADFDGDGDVDLFVGSRVVSRNYGTIPTSYLLENDGAGVFTNVTTSRAEALAEAGMITDAAWTDTNGDGQLDLVVAGEWMPIRLFEQHDGQFIEQTEAGFSGTDGWWNTIEAADMDGDGDVDLIGGNLGLNSALKTSPDEPVRMYVNDFDANGSLDHLLTTYKNGIAYPFASRDQLIQQVPSLAPKYATYADFGDSRLEEIFTPNQLRDALVEEVYTFSSAYFENDGSGSFTMHPLPPEAQFAPVYAILIDDFDADGHLDLMLAGNFFGVRPQRGRYDASYGLLARGDGQGGFESVSLEAGNLVIDGEVRALQPLRHADGSRLIVAARNDAALHVVRRRRP